MNLNYKEYGQGDPIIILHGLFGTLDNWQTIARKLAKNYSVFLIDQRNHGRSSHTDAIDYPLMAADLHEFMLEMGMYQAHIIGHSMGGKTAMQFALEYPDMVDKLVIVDITPKAYVGGHQTIFEALFSLDLDKLKNRKEADAILSERIDEFGVRQFLLKNLTREKEGTYKWKMNLPVIHKHYEDILAAIESDYPFEKSTLFIKGEKSNYITEEDIPLIQSLFPEAKLETVEDAGHWVHAEKPKELLEMVTNFLDN